MISVVTPWRTLLSAFGLIGRVKSEWVLMSMKPGATARPCASITRVALPATRGPTAAMRPSATARSPEMPGLPVPSISRPPRIRMSYAMRSLVLERQSFDHGLAAEFRAQAIDRVLGRLVARAAAVDEVGRIRVGGRGERGDADAEEAEFRAVGLALEQLAPGGKDLRRQLGRRRERAGAGAQAEIRRLELERHGRAGKLLGLEPAGDFLRQAPQRALHLAECGDVGLERGLGGDAFRLALGAHLAGVDAVREPREPQALGAEAAHQLGLVGALQVGDDAESFARERAAHRLADAPDEGHGLRRQEFRRLGAAEH